VTYNQQEMHTLNTERKWSYALTLQFLNAFTCALEAVWVVCSVFLYLSDRARIARDEPSRLMTEKNRVLWDRIQRTHSVLRGLFCTGFKVCSNLHIPPFSHQWLFIFLLPPISCPVFRISYYVSLTSTPVLFLVSSYRRTIALLYKLSPPKPVRKVGPERYEKAERRGYMRQS
jgi:hypothetical protein